MCVSKSVGFRNLNNEATQARFRLLRHRGQKKILDASLSGFIPHAKPLKGNTEIPTCFSSAR